jgi:hypothetical protein
MMHLIACLREGYIMSARLSLALSLFLLASLFPRPAAARQPAPAAPQPRPVTLHATNVALSRVLADLLGQTGIRVEDQRGEGDASITVNLDRVPFWQALDAIAAAAGAGVYLPPRGGRIALVKRPAGRPAPLLSHDGFFRCSLRKVVTAHDLDTGDDRCTVFLEVAWEPGLLPLYLETRPQELRLLDDKRRPVPVSTDGSSLAPVDGRISLISEVQIPALPRSSPRIGLLEGRLNVIAPSKMLTFHFDALDRLDKAAPDAPERRQTQEGVVCRLGKIVLARDRWTVQVVLDYPPGNRPLESYQSWVVNNELVLEGPDGKRRLASSDYVLESSTPRHAVLSYHFRDRDKQVRGRPEDWHLTYRTPASVVEWPVRFSFKDVPLGKP